MLDEVMIAARVAPSTIGIRAAKVEYARACEDKESNKRYILFNTQWLTDLGKGARTAWVVRAVLAHEVGHHKKAHLIQLEKLNNCAPELEGQADEFAGETLAKLGATLGEVQSAYRAIVKDTNTGCYPPKSKRLELVKAGWEKVKAIELMKLYETRNSAEEYVVDENVDSQIYYASVAIRYEHTDAQYFDPIAYLFRARAHYDGKDERSDAIADLNEYVKYKPSDSDAYLLLAEYNWQTEDIKTTVDNLNKAIKLSPTSAKTYLARASFFFEQKKHGRAFADTIKAIELDPNYAVAYLYRGAIVEKEGDLDAALDNFTKAIELDGKEAAFYGFRAAIFKKKDRFDEALADYSKAIELNPSEADYYKHRSEVYRAQGKPELAEEDERVTVLTLQILKLSKLIEKNPRSTNLYRSRGLLLRFDGKVEEALADFTKAIEFEPASNSYAHRAALFEIKGHPDLALSDYTKAIELDPEDERNYVQRAKIYRARKEIALAEADEAQARELRDIYK